MLRITQIHSSPVILLLLMAALAFPAVASAQNSARLRGVVTDPDGNPAEGVSVTITFEGGIAREYVTTTNDEGEFLQMGLGDSIVTAGETSFCGTISRRSSVRARCLPMVS